MDTKKVNSIIKTIGFAIQNEQDAYDLIEKLSQEDWSWWLKNTHPISRWKDNPCVVCGNIMKDAGGPLSGMCQKCQYVHWVHINKLSTQRGRAKKAGLAYTLTLREWYETLNDFQWMCAYCRTSPYECMEHFVPVELGGGTTKSNCIPSCNKCNHLKKYKHPSKVTLIPKSEIERVHAYLAQF